MAAPLALVWDLIARDNASEAFKRVGEAAETTGRRTSKVSETVKKVGEATAAALATVVVVATKMAVEMQASDAKIQGNAQITAQAATSIGDAFLHTAGTSTFSGKQMADAFAPVAGIVQTLSGHVLTAADSLKMMRAATDLAEASGHPLAATTADLAAVMQTYRLKVGDAAEASNVLFNTSRLTGVELDTLTLTLDKLHAKLGLASPTLADTSGLLVDLARNGVSGSKGVLVVSTAMTTLLSGSKLTTNTLHALGVKVFDASGKFVGMHKVLAELTPKLAGMTQEQRHATEAALFGKNASMALDATILAGAKGFDTATAAVVKHNAVETAAHAASKTLEGQMKTLKASFADFMTLLGEKVIPVIQKVIGFLMQHKTAAMVLAGVIAGLLVAATAAWTVSLFAAGGALAFLMSPITLIVGAIALLALGVKYAWDHFKTFRTVVKDAFNAIRATVVTGVRVVLDVFLNMVGGIIHGAASAFGWIPGLGPKLRTARDKFDEFHTFLDRKLSDMAGTAAHHPIKINVDTSTATWKVQNFGAWFDGYLWKLSHSPPVKISTVYSTPGLPVIPGAGHARGGLISGAGTGMSDSINARLSNGEFVMPAAQTAGNLRALEAMRSGKSLDSRQHVTVNQTINNPVPETASVSGPAGLRRAALALGH